MKRSGFIKRSPIIRKPPKPKVERIPMAIPRPGEVKKEVEVEHTFRDGRTKINQLCKEGRDLYQQRKRDAWEKQKRICPICREHLNWSDSTVDHIKPRKMGAGSIDDRAENLQAVHATCNSLKGSRPMSDFEVFIP
jgi:5-methylcytosine-specific restriction endonuclease McrA